MHRHTQSEVVVDAGEYYYYDWHQTEEERMGESERQRRLIAYLVQVLEWQYRQEQWYISSNMNLYETRNRQEEPVAPDVAVFVGLRLPEQPQRNLRSWPLWQPGYPAPGLVVEVASESTWERDVREKPGIYARIGVAEYFAYDPRPGSTERLRGWRTVQGRAEALVPDRQGRLWSEVGESWLEADGAYLRLLDRAGQRRPTGEEAERAAKERAWARLRALGVDPESLEE